MTYTFDEFATVVEEYARLVMRGHADRDLTTDEASDVGHLLSATVPNLRRQKPDGVDPRAVAVTHARQLATAEGISRRATNRTVDILRNL